MHRWLSGSSRVPLLILGFSLATLTASFVAPSQAVTLYTTQGPITVNDNGAGSNLPGMTLSRGTTASDVVYFRFVVKPISDYTSENYFAGLELFQGGSERLGVGNAFLPFAYSAFNTVPSGDVDLKSATPEPSTTYQLVRSTDQTRIIFRVQYVSGAAEHITVWLNPDPALSEAAQPAALTTTFDADATFDEMRLREGGGASGWTFSDIAVASSFNDLRGRFVDATSGPLGGPSGSQGVAWGDYDGDGDLDLCVTSLSASRLYRNEGSGVFADATAGQLGGNGIGQGVVWGDYDNDGDLDVFIGYEEGDRLFRNDGAGVFADVSKGPMVSFGQTEGLAWGDFDNDDDLDIFVTGANRLLRNDGGAVFADATSAPLLGSGNGPGVTWGDYDNDGDLDVFLAAFNLPSKLFRNDGGGVFVDVTSGPMGVTEASIGAAWGDYDNDGDLDLFLARLSSASKLFRNDGGGAFADVTSGPLAAPAGGAGWGDYDNDGDLDLYQPGKLLRNDGGGAFADATTGPLGNTGGDGKGTAWGDYDNDGDLDLYIANATGSNKLLRNEATVGNHWLQVKLRGTASNRAGIGARVKVVASGIKRIRELSGGSGYLAQDALVASFGLGAATSIDSLIVSWPSGIVQVVSPVPAVDGAVTVVERGQAFTRLALGPFANGRGSAWGDYDSDGDLDLYVTVDALSSNQLLRNDGPVFVNATSGPLAGPGAGKSAAWGDYDNDLDLDLYLTFGNGSKLFRNNGGGAFADVTSATSGSLAESAVWGDYDNDGDLDLYLARESNGLSKLLRNDGAGVFVNATSGPLAGGPSVAAAWGDYDNDGDLDLYRSCGDGNNLFRNDGGGTFVDVASALLVSFNSSSRGIAWGDFDNDADLDLAVVGNGTGLQVFRNDGATWTNATTPNMSEPNFESVAVTWTDYDHDGDLDIYTTGYFCHLFRTEGGSFVDVADGVTKESGYDAAWGDVDNDGDLDAYVTSNGRLLRNHDATGNHWVKVQLRGTVSNRAAIGARVKVKAGGITRIREISGGNGWFSQNSLIADFGLGASTTIDSLIVRWPSGIVQAFHSLATNKLYSLVEGANALPVDDALALPRTLELAPATPNPFQNSTRIDYALPAAARVRLTVHDVQGRCVATLADGEYSAGRHSATWNGKVADGTKAGAGVYFVRLQSGQEGAGQSVFRKVVCAK